MLRLTWGVQNMLDHMLSIHVRSRVFPTLQEASQFIKSVSMLYDAYVETKNIGKQKVGSAMPSTTSVGALGTLGEPAVLNR